MNAVIKLSHLHVVGSAAAKNRIIKIFGNRFNLDEIEERMKQNNLDVACTDINDKLDMPLG